MLQSIDPTPTVVSVMNAPAVRFRAVREHSASIETRVCLSEEDRMKVFRQRYRVYVAEMGLYGDLPSCRDGYLHESADDGSTLLLAEHRGVPVGSLRVTMGSGGQLPAALVDLHQMRPYLAIMKDASAAIMMRFTVNREYRHSRAVLQLVSHAANVAIESGVQLVFLACASERKSLHTRLGFRSYGESFSSGGFDSLTPMVLVVGDSQHLAAVRSPVLENVKNARVDARLVREAVGLIGGNQQSCGRSTIS
jgi:hypothetical protein